MRRRLVKYQYWLLIGYLGTLTGCAHVYYSPNAHNVPLLREKGEKVVSAAIGSGTNEVDFGLDIQAAYALTNRIGLMGNYYRAEGSGGGTDNPEAGRGHLFEFGAGYFIPLKDDFSFEIFGGTGKGKVYNYDEHKTSTSRMYFTRYFVQPTVGWKHEAFDIALSNRFAWLTYDKLQATEYNQVTYPSYHNRVEQGLRYFLIEPALTLRAGLSYAKVQLQMGYSLNQTNRLFPQERFNFNLGLQFDFWSRSTSKAY